MPLNGPVLAQLMTSQCSSSGLLGSATPGFCQAFSNGLVTSFLATNNVTTADVGVMAAGTGTGTVAGLIPSALTSLAYPLCVSSGAAGQDVQALVSAMSQAICVHFLTGIVNTTSPLVAVGSGTGKIVGLVPATMTSAIMGQMPANQIEGVAILPFVNSFCTAFCAFILANALVQVVLVGVPAPLILGVPVPSVGIGNGKVT